VFSKIVIKKVVKMSEKILFVSNMYPSSEKPYSGIFVKNLYENLVKAGADIQILTMERRFTSPLGSIVKYLAFLASSVKYLFTRYDVVHLHFFYPLIMWVWAYKFLHPSSKVVLTFHGSDINAHFSGGLSKWLASEMVKAASCCIAVSHSLKTAVEEKLAVTVNYVLPAGIDTAVFNRAAERQVKRYDFIFVGSFIERKGIPEYLEAIKMLSGPYHFCFVGSGTLGPSIRSLDSTHEVTVFENLRQSEIANLYQESRFLVLPSRSEPFGLVVSEAMYCGTPALASREGGIVMQISEGENGYLFEKENVSAITEVLRKAATMEASTYCEMADRASSSNEEFSLEKVTHQHLALYLNLPNER
jgi:glycosyltransferase involved in cell wall biosynthesis